MGNQRRKRRAALHGNDAAPRERVVIEPGRGFPGVLIGESTVAEVVQTLGPEATIERREPEIVIDSPEVTVKTREGRVASIEIKPGAVELRTAGGVGCGSTADEVARELGESATSETLPGCDCRRYDLAGIELQVDRESGRVRSLTLFAKRPSANVGHVLGSHSPTRCPRCAGEIAPAAIASCLVCELCLARHHEPCWQGACAVCRGEKALVDARVTPIRASDPYQPTKRWINRAWAVSLVLAVVYTIAAITLVNEHSAHEELNPFVLAVASLLQYSYLNFAIASALVFLVDLSDAIVRRRRDPASGNLPLAVAALGVFFGFASFAYYLRWGSAALPPRRGA
jgi:hypothetical protein